MVLTCTQIVKADDVKDATLKEKGKQNEASTIAWLTAEKLDEDLITMQGKQFSAGFKACLVEFNQKYKTFPSITGDVIYDDIVPKLYTKELAPGKLYWFSYWNVTKGIWGRWQRTAKPGETGLFFPGWDDDPIMSVYCWNFGYPSVEKAFVPPPVIPEGKTEYVYYPGTKKVVVYGPDTVLISKSKVQIEKNDTKSFTFNNNQSFDVNTSASFASNNFQQQSNCGCPNPNIQTNNVQSCGCTRDQMCQYHYNQLPQKEKKKFGQTTVGKVLKYVLVYAAGVGTGLIIANNSGHSSGSPTNPIIQPPFDPILPVSNIYTQPPVEPVYN